MRGLKSFKRDDEAVKKEGEGHDDEDEDDDQSMSSGGKNGEDDDDEKSDAAEDFFFDFPALQYDAYESVRDEFEKSAIGKEANKFAEYERRLREWEDRERTRESHQRAQQKTAGGQKGAAGSGPDGKLTPSEERRRAFFAAAAARGHFFDQEGYVVDKNGKRKKNKKGQFVRFHPGMEEQFGVKKNGNKKGKKEGAAAAGAGQEPAAPSAAQPARQRAAPQPGGDVFLQLYHRDVGRFDWGDAAGSVGPAVDVVVDHPVRQCDASVCHGGQHISTEPVVGRRFIDEPPAVVVDEDSAGEPQGEGGGSVGMRQARRPPRLVHQIDVGARGHRRQVSQASIPTRPHRVS